MLEVRGLVTNYGPIRALDDIDLEVKASEIVALIGANGAGKSTLLKSIMNLTKPVQGRIRFHDQEIRGLATEVIVRKGIVLVPEGRAILKRMTVLENLLMGAYISNDTEQIDRELEQVFARFPALRGKKNQLAGALSGGQQQMLAIGRGLMANPELLILDEPSLGLAPLLVKEIFDIIRHLHQSGTTILLVEQNAKKALQVSDRAYVLELGHITLSGRSAELLEMDQVRSAYLGESA